MEIPPACPVSAGLRCDPDPRARLATAARRVILVAAVTMGLWASGQEVRMGTPMVPVGSGARAMGQGNAFIAVADDATAASWNPGGLTQLERPECSFAVEYLSGRAHLESRQQPEMQGSSGIALQDLNYLSVVYPFHPGRNLVLSLNYLKLYRFDRDLATPVYAVGEGISSEYHYHLSQRGSLAVIAPAIAIEVTERLSLGLTVNLWNDDLTGASEFTTTQRERGTIHYYGDRVYDSLLENRYTVRRGYSAVLGALYRLSPEWTLGAVAKPPFTLDLENTWSFRYGRNGMAPQFAETEEDAELEFPWVLGVGAAWRPSDALTLSGDVTWANWSQYNLRSYADFNPITNQREDAGRCRDTTTCRLGAEYLLIYPAYIVPLRAGLGYDPGPSVDKTDTFYTASLGTGLQWSRYALDVAYEARWGHGVNSALYPGWGVAENVLSHRVLASLIVYF